MAFNIYQREGVYFQFQCKDTAGRPIGDMLSDGPYYLLQGPRHRDFTIDFEDAHEGVDHWYIEIRFGCHHAIVPQPGDLLNITYLTPDIISTVFLANTVVLKRVALELSPGPFRFPYKNASSFDGIIVDYTVGHDSTVVMQVVCSGITTDFWTFPLVRNDDQFSFTIYTVKDGSRSISKFQEEVGKVCPYETFPEDFKYLIFATHSTVLTVAGGGRIPLERKN
ncbi:hypothetical protein FOL47_008459 [Perkinsus chesapeaki]|uniref:Uncharacterized protein n=1 Tax=Perkinsus chesapeaki TaxID=330153 RepID=A0A7J6LDT9_PERCH|nr:hypothetical protein FOL47_008459 [Perkinsus chesapeaki]